MGIAAIARFLPEGIKNPHSCIYDQARSIDIELCAMDTFQRTIINLELFLPRDIQE